MKLITDSQGVTHLTNDAGAPKICPFKPLITQQVKPAGSGLVTPDQNKMPQLMQVPQTCNDTCPHFHTMHTDANFYKVTLLCVNINTIYNVEKVIKEPNKN